jgi:hypothetical protein
MPARQCEPQESAMNNDDWDEFEPAKARLRALVESVDRSIALAFSRGVATEAPHLADAWGRLISGLALGTAPEMRRCPFCQRRVPKVATRCRFCLKASDTGVSGVETTSSPR